MYVLLKNSLAVIIIINSLYFIADIKWKSIIKTFDLLIFSSLIFILLIYFLFNYYHKKKSFRKQYEILKDIFLRSKIHHENKIKVEKHIQILTEIAKNKMKNNFELLSDQSKNDLINKWEKELPDLISSNYSDELLISHLLGKKKLIKRNITVINNENSIFDQILSSLSNYHTDSIFQNEREFETFIHAKLESDYKNLNINRQDSNSETKPDIVIDNDIAIELKIAHTRSDLQRALGQIMDYKDVYNKIILVLLDTNEFQEIDKYITKFTEMHVPVIILQGRIKKQK